LCRLVREHLQSTCGREENQGKHDGRERKRGKKDVQLDAVDERTCWGGRRLRKNSDKEDKVKRTPNRGRITKKISRFRQDFLGKDEGIGGGGS